MKTLIINCGEIVTPKGYKPVHGKQMDKLTIYKNSAIELTGSVITAIQPQETFNLKDYQIIDADGKSVLPGFIDSHTHYVFSGSRCDEFFLRMEGRSYIEILNNGNGILDTVNSTANTSETRLLDICSKRLDDMLAQGITTVEGKSGYGLDKKTELMQLGIMKKLNSRHPVETIATYLGGHAVPQEYRNNSDDYIDFMIGEMLPIIKAKKLADFCDIFCEDGAFNTRQSERFLRAAKKAGFGVKIHADEIASSGGTQLAAGIGAVSADHLLSASDKDMGMLAASDTVATLLPCTAFCLNSHYAPARKMMDNGCAVALASDFNPGSCFCQYIPFIMALSFFEMKMTLNEIITALTLNGAAAINRADITGSIDCGKQADLILLNGSDYRHLIYNTAANLVDTVIKNGKIVYKK